MRDKFMVSSSVRLVPDLNTHASRFDGKGIGSHQAERFGKTEFYGINGSEDSNQGHNPKSNDHYSQDGPQ